MTPNLRWMVLGTMLVAAGSGCAKAKPHPPRPTADELRTALFKAALEVAWHESPTTLPRPTGSAFDARGASLTLASGAMPLLSVDALAAPADARVAKAQIPDGLAGDMTQRPGEPGVSREPEPVASAGVSLAVQLSPASASSSGPAPGTEQLESSTGAPPASAGDELGSADAGQNQAAERDEAVMPIERAPSAGVPVPSAPQPTGDELAPSTESAHRNDWSSSVYGAGTRFAGVFAGRNGATGVGAGSSFTGVGAGDGFAGVGAGSGYTGVGAGDGFAGVGAGSGYTGVGAGDGFAGVGAESIPENDQVGRTPPESVAGPPPTLPIVLPAWVPYPFYYVVPTR